MFTFVSTLFFLLLTLMWRGGDWTNLAFKFAFAVLTGWGGYLLYTGAF